MKLGMRLVLAGMGAGLALWNARRKQERYTFQNKVVALTGGSRGLGLAMARQLVEEGAIVALLARSEDSIARAIEDLEGRGRGRALGLICDVTDAQSVETAFGRLEADLGRVDVLINNAGSVLCAPFDNHTPDHFEEAIATHLYGPVHTIRAVLPMMRLQGAGRILNVSSIGGKIGIPHMTAYSASKFSLVGFSKSLAAELRGEDIYVTVACPGLMRTGSHRSATFSGNRSGEFRWFSTLEATPGLSVAADRAARRILNACRLGRAEFVFPGHWKVAAIGDALAPELSATANHWVNRALPDPIPDQNESAPGVAAGGEQLASWRLRSLEQAAADLNQG